MTAAEAIGKQRRPVIQKALQTPFRPSLPLAPKRPPTHHGLLINDGIPQHAHLLPGQQQTEAEIQIVGDGVFVEAAAIQQHLTANQLTVAAQFANAPLGNAAQLHFSVKSHLQRLGARQPVAIGPNNGLAQLHSSQGGIIELGLQPQQHIGRQGCIGIEHQQPIPVKLGQQGIERPGFTTTGIAGPAPHLQEGMGPAELVEDLWCAVLAAVIHHPELEAISGVIQASDGLHQPGDHLLLIAGGHQHIDGRNNALSRWSSIRRSR